MRQLAVFNHVTLDGYFVDANGSMSWAKGAAGDPEWDAFVAANAGGGGTLLFGRITYEMMAGYWPTPLAREQAPAVADGMNRLPKVVFSRTLERPTWSNTTLVKGDPVAHVRGLKKTSGDGMVILGSGTIVSQLTAAGLIDEYQIVVNPLVLGGGRTLFEGIREPLRLRLAETRSFANGNVFLRYQRAA